MKKILIILVIIIISFLNLICKNISLPLDLKITDKLYDSKGAGNIIYPSAMIYSENSFDIKQIEIKTNENFYIFSTEVRGKINKIENSGILYENNLESDFFLPMVHIYIDLNHIDSLGITNTIPGTNATISPESAWEKAVVIASMPFRYERYLYGSKVENRNRIVVSKNNSINNKRNKIIAKIKKQKIGEFSANTGFTIVMLAQSLSGIAQDNILISPVKSTAGQYNFGGGELGLFKRYNPNILDLITPFATSQKKILVNYSEKKEKYVVLPAYYPWNSKERKNQNYGNIKQVSENKLIIDLGSEDDLKKGSILYVNEKYKIKIIDIFPEMAVAKIIDNKNETKITKKMRVYFQPFNSKED